MPEFISNLFLTRQFIPHGHCYLWKPGLVWLHLMSDALVTLAYYLIGLMLVYFVRKRSDVPFDWMFLMFGTFIVACGTTHVMEIWTLWHPTYWLSGLIKLITAIASVSTAILLVPLIPKALALPSPAQLEAANVALHYEIAERQMAQSALVESEKRYRALVELSPETVFVQSLGKFVLVNQAGAKLLGAANSEELVGREVLDFIHPEDRETVTRRIHLLQTENIEVPLIEQKWLKLDSTVIDVEVVAKSFNYGGKLAAQVVARDITKRKLFETTLQRALKEQQGIMNAISDIVYVLDRDGNLLKWNKSLEIITGLKPEVLQNLKAQSFFPATEAVTIARAIESAFENGEAQIEGNLIGLDRVAVPYEWKAVTLKDDVGNVIGIAGTGRDITQRKYVEKALYQINTNLEQQVNERTVQLQQALEFEAMLRRITDKVRDSLDESQILQTVVQELVLVLGVSCCNTALYNLEKGTSTICYEYAKVNPQAQARQIELANLPQVYQQLLQGQSCQFCSIVPNPIRGRVTMLAYPIFDDQGVLGDLWLINHPSYIFNEREIRLVQQVVSSCAIAIRQARLYAASKKQIQELEKLHQLKDDFLSSVSHELRTPLTNMKMAIHLLKVAKTELAQERYLEVLQSECVREIELVNNLLDLQRLEAATYSISPQVVILNDWLPLLLEPFKLRTQKRQQRLNIDISPSISELICDQSCLERILVELLNNACKYTADEGEITLNIRAELNCSPFTHKPEPMAIFTISNSTEIPAVELPRIFEKFYRVPNADPWKQGGTGLGLALVQKLVAQLQGTISVESVLGWTTFSVKLPNQILASSDYLN
jgi:PAS domain S-box-containing protein